MPLTLTQYRAVTDLAGVFYEFLPGSGNERWVGHVSFRTIAEKVGVHDFWRPGSKLPMITSLLQRTLEERPTLFERLVLEIVRSGIIYRQKQQKPITSSDIIKVNGLLLEVGFKFADLWDPSFLSSMDSDGNSRAKRRVEEMAIREEVRIEESKRALSLRQLKDEFFNLHAESSKQRAGLQLERILNKLFALNELSPREPFRVIGEQIDGSFDLDHETYLLEAKWEKTPVPEAPLLIFRGKIEGKSAFTRGVFVSLNGISEPARHAITQGKQPTFFTVDGFDLTMVLSGEVSLLGYLRVRRRLLADKGSVVVPFSEILASEFSRSS